MTNERTRLREKLCREIAQAELSAILHPEREARRLGDVPPAEKLLEISAHAKHMRPRLDALLVPNQPVGIRVGRLVGEMFSNTRHFFFDRFLSTERSYRATLLGLHHGIGIAKLLRELAQREDLVRLHRFCDDLIADREPLLREAERVLAWFADHPDIASASGLRNALAPSPRSHDAAPVLT